MNKIKEFSKKHSIISALIVLVLTVLLFNVIVWIITSFFTLLGNGIKMSFQFFREYVCTKENWIQIIDKCNITQSRVINAVFFYVVLCISSAIIITIFNAIMAILIGFIEGFINIMDKIVLGKMHQKSIEYNGITLWYIKFKADITYFLDWLRYDVLKIRYWFGETDTKIRRVRILSLENMVSTIKNIIKFLFNISIVHFAFGMISVYVYYEKEIRVLVNNLKNMIEQGENSLGNFIDIFEVLTVLCLIAYIVFDIRHKASGFSDLRAERFKELVQMEEKLLNILSRMGYSLQRNIDVIADRKPFILQNGAKELSGKQCYIYKSKIEFVEKNEFGYWCQADGMYQFSKLDDMKEEFQKLSDLEDEFKKSALNSSNIYLIDHQTMLTRVVHFWIIGRENKEYKKMEFFCKSSMEKWYKNRFVKPVVYDEETVYYSEEQTKKQILDASISIDDELVRAMWLELYLKRYERKMNKRFKRIN